MLSNDHLVPKDRMTDPDITEHTIWGVFQGDCFIAPGWPLLLTFCFLVLNQLFGKIMFTYLVMLYPSLEIGDVKLYEDLDNYWASLDQKDRAWSTKEDQYSTDKLSLQILTVSQKDNMNYATETLGRTLQGCHSYDILANPLYFDDFQYVSASLENRKNYIIDDDDDEDNDAVQSDIVRYALNLAYMNEQEAQNFKFDQVGVAQKIKQN